MRRAAYPEGWVAGCRSFWRDYLDQPLDRFYADFRCRLVLYGLLALMFLVEGLVALAVYKGPGILISYMAFATVYSLHAALAFTLCHWGVDVLIARLRPGWGGYDRRTVGRQWLIWAGGLPLALVAHRIVVKGLIHVYAPDVVQYHLAHPGAEPSHLAAVLYVLPYWAAAIWLAIQVALRTQRNLTGSSGAERTALPRIEPASPEGAAAAPDGGRLEVPTDAGPLSLPVESISHVTVEDHYCRIHYTDGPRQRQVLIRHPLKEMLGNLPGDLFLQVHRSHVVNLGHVTGLIRRGRSLRVVLRDVHLPVSRHRWPQVHPRLRGALGRRR